MHSFLSLSDADLQTAQKANKISFPHRFGADLRTAKKANKISFPDLSGTDLRTPRKANKIKEEVNDGNVQFTVSLLSGLTAKIDCAPSDTLLGLQARIAGALQIADASAPILPSMQFLWVDQSPFNCESDQAILEYGTPAAQLAGAYLLVVLGTERPDWCANKSFSQLHECEGQFTHTWLNIRLELFKHGSFRYHFSCQMPGHYEFTEASGQWQCLLHDGEEAVSLTGSAFHERSRDRRPFCKAFPKSKLLAGGRWKVAALCES